MKKLSFILLAATLSISLSAFSVSRIANVPEKEPVEKVQVPSTEEYFAEADIIVEAKRPDNWTSLGGSYDAVGNYNRDDIYTSSFHIVTRIFKNNSDLSISPGDTLHVITKGGSIFKGATIYEEERISSRPQTDEIFQLFDYPSFYFLNKSDFPDNPDISKRNNHPKVTLLRSPKRTADKEDSIMKFDNRYELYKYMEQFEGVTVPLSDQGHMRWHLGGDSEEFKQYLKERNLKDPRAPQGQCH